MKPRGDPVSLRAACEASLLRLWFAAAPSMPQRLLRALLTPLTLLTSVVSTRRRQQIDGARKRRASGACPAVVVIGNLVAGGGGKTPLVLALAADAVQRGLNVGLIARGTGTLGHHAPHRVAAGDHAAEVGDEALMLARSSGLPVVIGHRRGAALAHLCETEPGLDVVFSDDGLQHVGLSRDLEIIVLDGRGLGNGRLLPAGPLRESPQLLANCAAIVDNLGWQDKDAAVAAEGSTPAEGAPSGDRSLPGDGLKVTAAPTLVDQPAPPRFDSRYVVIDLLPLRDYLDAPIGHPAAALHPSIAAAPQTGASNLLDVIRLQFARGRVAAVAGIANPESFFGLLESLGAQITRHAPGDHASPGAAWYAALPEPLIVVTAKDAVKCADDAQGRIHVLRIAARPDPALCDWLAVQLHRRCLGPKNS